MEFGHFISERSTRNSSLCLEMYHKRKNTREKKRYTIFNNNSQSAENASPEISEGIGKVTFIGTWISNKIYKSEADKQLKNHLFLNYYKLRHGHCNNTISEPLIIVNT